MNTIRLEDGFIHVLSGLLDESKIAKMLEKADEKGWEPALVNIGNGKQVYRPDARKCDRSMVMDEELAAEIWELIKHVVPSGTNFGEPVGLNPLFRYLKYSPGEYFKQHHDGTYEDSNGNKSRLTVQMYLNDGYTGGETIFYETSYDHYSASFYENTYKAAYTHVPKKGDVVVFDQQILHEGAIVKSGSKIAVRTEVMFKD
jgi:predicted 2-oxoglutarate/Fe(II)-dependent dioxygenase YbiX